jgi:hypothetical protein
MLEIKINNAIGESSRVNEAIIGNELYSKMTGMFLLDTGEIEEDEFKLILRGEYTVKPEHVSACLKYINLGTTNDVGLYLGKALMGKSSIAILNILSFNSNREIEFLYDQYKKDCIKNINIADFKKKIIIFKKGYIYKVINYENLARLEKGLCT